MTANPLSNLLQSCRDRPAPAWFRRPMIASRPPHLFADVLTRIHAVCNALAAEGVLPAGLDLARVVIEPTKDASHGDMATNAAMVLAKEAKAKPKDLAEAIAAKLRADDMKRMMAQAGNGTTGTAEKATAPRKDSGYVAALTSKIKGNIAYSGSTDVPGNPRAVFKIEQLPTGEIISVRKIKSSGLPAYDSSVENAIKKSSPLPKKKDGTVEREIELIFEMKE